MSDVGAAAAALAQHRAKLHGIAWMLVTGLLFVAVTGIVRHLGSDMEAIQAAFIRYAFGLIMISPVLFRMRHGSFTFASLRLHAARGLVHGVAVMLWFYAMARIPIAQVTAIGFTAPIFISLGAALFLGERLQARRIGAILIGFGGTLVILRPGLQEIQLGALAQLTAAPLFAVSYLIAKKLTGTETSSSIVAFLSIFVTLILLPPALMVWRTPTLEELFWLAMTALCATLGHYTMTRAMQAAPLTVIQPFSFLQLVWATLLGLYAFGEAPDFWTWVGAGIIVSSATYIAHRETVRRGRADLKPGPY